MNIVAISGKLYSGKTSLAKNLEQTNPIFGRAALAHALKQDICRLCGVNMEYLNEHKDLFRPVLQWYGTEYRRKVEGDDYWVKRLVEALSKYNDRIVWLVDDVRFPNELSGLEEAAYASGGKFVSVRLMIDKITQIKRHVEKFNDLPDDAIFDHPSETALDDAPVAWDLMVQANQPPLTIATYVYDGLLRRGVVVDGVRYVGEE
jgi:hypothetical protein